MKKNKLFKTGGSGSGVGVAAGVATGVTEEVASQSGTKEVASQSGTKEVASQSGTKLNNTAEKIVGNMIPNLTFFTLIGPYILIGFFVLLSIFNLNIKGVMYISGLIFVLFFSNILKLIIPNGVMNMTKCNIYTGPASLGSKLPFSTIVYTYTFIYLLIPMIVNSMMNYAILISLLMVLSSDILIMIKTCDVKFPLLLMTIIMVVIIGGTWTMIINSYMSDVTYHTDYLSDKQVCSMPSKQNLNAVYIKTEN